jgi:hypothetical protein
MTVIPLELTLGLLPSGFLFRMLNSILGVFTNLFPSLLGYQILLVAQSRRTKS